MSMQVGTDSRLHVTGYNATTVEGIVTDGTNTAKLSSRKKRHKLKYFLKNMLRLYWQIGNLAEDKIAYIEKLAIQKQTKWHK